MPRRLTFLPIFLLAILLITACSPVSPAAESPTPPAQVATATPLPTQTSIAATATPSPASGTPLTGLTSLHMLDAQTGWAWAAGQLLHTTDGGKTWTDRTPAGYQFTDTGFFLDGQNAWLPVYLTEANRTGLLHTGDGGSSWAQYPQGPASGLHFTDTQNGWAVTGDVGAGNVYFSLSQTRDGGKTWAPIPVKPPSPEGGLPPGTIHLCNICNDAFYYDPARMIIIYGDMGSMEPGGSVRGNVSFDQGNTWQAFNLPLPQGETEALVAPETPVFYSDRQGILPIHLLKMSPEGSYSAQRLVFYATLDGGKSWSQLPTILDPVAPFTTISVDPSQDVFIPCGSALCVSHDRARTWQTVSSNLDFTTTDTRSITGPDFVSGSTGWALVMDNEITSLYTTTDGGATWAEIAALLVAAIPPTVTIDTSIPTPTPVPTATLEPSPTPAVVFDAQANADRVTFAPNATWAEVSSSLTASGEKRFVLSALQNQVMSVSVPQGAPFTVAVAGADKRVFTDAQNPQFYWRGELPSTQDYFVTVKSPVAGPFTLRIAINPPGLPYQYFEFFDPQTGALLDYSDEFAPISWQLPFSLKGTPLLTLYFIEPSYYYPTSNLNEAALVLTASTDSVVVASCTQAPAGSGEVISGTVSINGYTFTQSEFVGAAAGNLYDQLFHRTVVNDTCFEVVYLIHSSEIGNYPPATVAAYDRPRLLHKFDEVLGSFAVK